MDLYVITGASRGLGRSLAQQLMARDRTLLTIARNPDRSLEEVAAAAGVHLTQWALDLSHDIGVAARLEAWLHQQASRKHATAALINNAGLLGRVGPVDAMDAEELVAVLRVGLEAPMVLAAAFLRATRHWPAQRRVLNVSSGAGRRPITGWAAYCAAKAGLDHFSRVTAEDEKLQPNPARIVALGVGVIDTDMQRQLRAAEDSGFPDKARFVEFKESGQLAAPDEAAARVIAYLSRPDFGANPVADVRDA
ncbi:MAG: SDR family NAD(P)-dependent oxidoreductase [Gemmatimonadota bacterium]